MSEASKSIVASNKYDKIGPDYFSLYTCEVAELLSQDDNSLLSPQPMHDASGKPASSPSYNPLFSNGLGASLSDVRKEKLNALLKESASVLNLEVDEVHHPVLAMQNLQSELKRKQRQSSNSDSDAGQFPQKKHKDDCCVCSTTRTSQRTTDPKSLCSSCRKKYGHGDEPLVGSEPGAEKASGEYQVDSDLQYLLESDNTYVEEMVKKYSDEYFATLEHMGKHLEEILDTGVSTCRPMTLGEKQQLRKQIQKLPPKNLDRVAEIIQSKRLSVNESSQDIHVYLEKEDNVTLWRLHYYVEAVDNAKKLSV